MAGSRCAAFAVGLAVAFQIPRFAFRIQEFAALAVAFAFWIPRFAALAGSRFAAFAFRLPRFAALAGS